MATTIRSNASDPVDVAPGASAAQAGSSSKRPSVEVSLHDAFAISHYDRREAPQRTDKRFLDVVTVGHILIKVRNIMRADERRRAAAKQMLDTLDAEFDGALQAMSSALEQLRQECDADPLVGALPAPASTKGLPIPWDDRRFWLLVRMTIVLDEQNRRLNLLLQRGAITKDVMKRRQREIARPFRAALQLVADRAGALEKLKLES